MTQIKKTIPEFKNREEEAKFFDTHDMANYQHEFKTVDVKFAKNLSEGITIRFDKSTLKKAARYSSSERCWTNYACQDVDYGALEPIGIKSCGTRV